MRKSKSVAHQTAVDAPIKLVLWLFMDFVATSLKLASLGHEQRLRIFHQLVRAGRGGMTIGQIRDALDRPMSTVAFHLRELVEAGMVTQEKEGRSVCCRASFEALNEMLEFISSECCQGVSLPAFSGRRSAQIGFTRRVHKYPD